MTRNLDSQWMAQQARNLSMFFDDLPDKPKYFVCDRDTKFTTEFEEILKTEDTELKRVAIWTPNQNAYVERFVQSIKTECLDLFVILGEQHLRRILSEFVDYYHGEWPHLGLGNIPPVLLKPPDVVESLGPADVVCYERPGGLLKHCERKVALVGFGWNRTGDAHFRTM